MKKNVAQLARYIRFQLSQLKSQNRHHDFEHLCRHLARIRISDRLIPATGPVGHGGDLGRDFESYRSYLSTHSPSSAIALAATDDKKLVFACSLASEIAEKIRADIRTICSGPLPVDAAYYFAETDIPVGVRQKLQSWAKKTFNVELEIFDGQAIAEELTSPEAFWIAEEFLGVSADQYPQTLESESTYGRYKTRWFETARIPENFADFFEIKYGLRAATFTKKYKPDLGQWISSITTFTRPESPTELQRKAKYEICVAALRGQNNLDKYSEYLTSYFAVIDELSDPVDLLDATTLLSYCSTAQCVGHLHADPAQLHAWTRKLEARLTLMLGQAGGPGQRCSLLQCLGIASRLQFRHGTEPTAGIDDLFKYWGMLADEVAQAPLFPLEDFADLLTVVTPLLGEDPRFQSLTRRIDQLLEERTGGYVAAEKCRDRAVAHLEAGQVIQAIKQLHTARIKWFSAETLRASVFAMLTLADCYSRLGLEFAAAYYALGAVITTFRARDDSLKKLLARSSFIAADHFYGAGASITYLQMLNLAFLGHGTYVDDPGDIERHEEIRRAMSHTIILRAFARRFNPEIARLIDGVIDNWPVDLEWMSELKEISEDESLPYYTDSEESVWARVQREMAGPICGDLGRTRRIVWQALGLHWVVLHENTYEATLIAEEFVATCQIVAADLAGVDLGLLPTTVELDVALSEDGEFRITETPDNEKASWSVQLPREWLGAAGHLDELRGRVTSVVAAVIHGCSVLDDESFLLILESSFEQGLAAKTFSVRSYAELYREVLSREMFEATKRASVRPPWYGRIFEHPVSSEIAWNAAPGHGYTREKSEEFIRNRYENAIKPVRRTLAALSEVPDFREVVRSLRNEGLKDWFILLLMSNLIVQYRVEKRLGNGAKVDLQTREMKAEMALEEPEGTPLPPVTLFAGKRLEMQKKVTWVTIAKTWGLQAPRRTPDFGAYRELLVAKYGCGSDDVPHADPFSGSSPAASEVGAFRRP